MGDDFATYLHRLFRAADLSVPQVASRSGVPLATIHNWIQRKVRKPQWQSLLHVLWTLGVTQPQLDDLLQRVGHPPLVRLMTDASAADQALCVRWIASPPPAPSGIEHAYQLLKGLHTHRLPDVRPLALPSEVPFKPNSACIGRKPLLRTIVRWLAQEQAIQPIVLMGEGGMGKTMLANEVVHRYGPFFAGGVWWVSCARPDAIWRTITGWIGPGKLQDIPGFAALHPERQITLVKGVLSNPMPRLLVFDECEDPAILAAWMPTHGGCRALVTSRAMIWDPATTYQLRVTPLARADSIAVLQQAAPDVDFTMGNELAAELGDMPLALQLVARYLQRYRHHITPAKYFEQHLQQPSSPLSTESELAALATILAPSLLRLDLTCRVDALATDILQSLAWCVPGTMVPRSLSQMIWVHTMNDAERGYFQHEEAMTRLASLGLIQDQGSIVIHPLLARLVRERFGAVVLPTILHQLISCFASENEATRAIARWDWLPHLQALARYSIEQKCNHAAAFCLELGHYCWRIGAGEEACQWSNQALILAHTANDASGVDSALNILSLALLYQGEYVRAEQYSRERLARLGHTHPDHRHGEELSNLGYLLMLQGRYAEATRICRQALHIRVQYHGHWSRQVGHVLHNLGYLALKQGRLARARRLLIAALSIRTAIDAPLLARAFTISTLGEVLLAAGQPQYAADLFTAGARLRQQEYGAEHPALAESLYLQASAALTLGHYDQAAVWLETGVRITREMMGDIHRQMVFLLTAQGRLALYLQQYGHARTLLHQAWDRATAALGPTHPETATVWFWQGIVAAAAQDWQTAEQALTTAHTLRAHLWPGHYQHGEVAIALDYVLWRQQPQQAHSFVAQAWQQACQAGTEHHPIFQLCYHVHLTGQHTLSGCLPFNNERI